MGSGKIFSASPVDGLLKGHWSLVFVVSILIAATTAVFWLHISGSVVFIGESDRLASYLNMRLVEYDALKEYGRVPDWNQSMFGGFSVAALHWINLGKDPISYLLQLFSRRDLFQVLGFVSILSVLASCLTAFWYIREVTRANAASLVGALAYGLSVFSLHRATQVDNAHLTFVLIPLALLCLRRVSPDNLARPFAGLTLIMTALAQWGFLQEVAYSFLFFGAYTLYRVGVLASQGHRRIAAPIVVMGCASAVALLFAGPRLITIGQEYLLLGRTSTFHYYDYSQALRFLHEGIYGRFFEENLLLGNAMNSHEGLQLVSSAALSFFVCLGIIRPRTRAEMWGAIFFFSVLAGILPTNYESYRAVKEILPLSLGLYKVITFGVLFFIAAAVLVRCGRYPPVRSTLRNLIPSDPRPADTVFHLYALATVLFLILVLEGSYVVYYFFGRADFTHTRLSILAVLPLCTLLSVYLAELRDATVSQGSQKGTGGLSILIAAIGVSAIAAYLIHGPLLDQIIPRDAARFSVLDRYELMPKITFEAVLMPTVVLRIVLTALLLAGLIAAVILGKSTRFDIKAIAGLVIGSFVVFETLLYAHFKIAGPQTQTYPIAFRAFNYLNVPPWALRPPEEAKLAAFRQLIEAEKFRIVVLNNNARYGGTNISHIAQFWRARTISGYSTGVPKRLMQLPWPQGVQTLRSIDFTSTWNLNASIFPLLAFLNVKYLIMLTPDVYFNAITPKALAGEDIHSLTIAGMTYPLRTWDVGGITFKALENPVNVIPRHFLVERVIGRETPPPLLTHPYADPPKAGGSSVIRLFEDQVDDVTRTSYVEKYGVGLTRTFDASGNLDVVYKGDVIDVRVTPSERERFIVVNQTFHPRWKAYVGAKPLAVLPANAVMQGIVLPPHTGHVQLRFEPFSSSHYARTLMLAGLAGLICGFLALRHWQVSRQ